MEFNLPSSRPPSKYSILPIRSNYSQLLDIENNNSFHATLRKINTFSNPLRYTRLSIKHHITTKFHAHSTNCFIGYNFNVVSFTFSSPFKRSIGKAVLMSMEYCRWFLLHIAVSTVYQLPNQISDEKGPHFNVQELDNFNFLLHSLHNCMSSILNLLFPKRFQKL